MAEWSLFISAVLLVAALGWMAALVLLRLRRDRAARASQTDRARALTLLVQLVLEPGPEVEEKLRPFLRRLRLMAELVLELQLLIGGDERARVFIKLRELGLDRAFAARFQRVKLGRIYLEALAALGGAAAVETLHRAALDDSRPSIRVAALYYLIGLGEGVGLQALLDAAVAGRLEMSRPFYELVREVTAANPEETIAALHDRSLPAILRAMLIEAIGAAGGYAALDTLLAAANDEAEVRTAALRVLGRLMHPAAEGAIAKGLLDPVWITRCAAAEAAGRAQLTSLTPLLVELLDDPEWWVRLRAGEALAALGEPGREALRATAEAGASLARRTAQSALAEHLAA